MFGQERLVSPLEHFAARLSAIVMLLLPVIVKCTVCRCATAAKLGRDAAAIRFIRRIGVCGPHDIVLVHRHPDTGPATARQ
ncbi:hypothetical protein ATK86_0505 [Nocardia fluminea]|uniref:Uncharacterized protein n=1 Tax=Nocardia fluminea TaxID=134984 RepID=A0A2N3WX85_9NOCA|nr:hypothetical protein ATK86_0505 [Nocardia fluminea]